MPRRSVGKNVTATGHAFLRARLGGPSVWGLGLDVGTRRCLSSGAGAWLRDPVERWESDIFLIFKGERSGYSKLDPRARQEAPAQLVRVGAHSHGDPLQYQGRRFPREGNRKTPLDLYRNDGDKLSQRGLTTN